MKVFETTCSGVLEAAVAKVARPCCARRSAVPPLSEREPREPREPRERVREGSSAPQPPVAQPPEQAPACRSESEGLAGALGHRFAAEDTLLIFDWDDTLLPYTWLRSCGVNLNTRLNELAPEQLEHLSEVAATAREILLTARQSGQVVIVTNADRGWIQYSCSKFLPALAPVILDVKSVSARSTYRTSSLRDPKAWKALAFEHEIRRMYGDAASDEGRKKNILSFGDSLDEREALLSATTGLPNCRHKSVKFVDRPDIEEICHQHRLLARNLQTMVQYDCDMDLQTYYRSNLSE